MANSTKYSHLINAKFGMLSIIDIFIDKREKYSKRTAACICECGVKKNIILSRLINGLTKSCGCLQILAVKKSFTKHGLNRHKLYPIWKSMKGRCFREKDAAFKNYGGRGITVCDEWNNDFKPFFDWAIENGYNENLSIDRINNDGNYEPSNCRWADRLTQAINQRISVKNKTGCKGVFQKLNRWHVSIRSNKKQYFIGSYENIDEAIEARKIAELKYWAKKPLTA